MTTIPQHHHHYDTSTPVDEPIEIILIAGRHSRKSLTAWRTDHGTVAYSLTPFGSSTPESISNLQSARRFPGKARRGWQTEVIAFAEGGLYKIQAVL